MEITTTIIGLLILGLFLLPIYLISRTSNGKKKKLEKELFSEASRNELKLSENDTWNESAMGIDRTQNKIICIDWNGPERRSIIFDLMDIKSFEPFPDHGSKKGNSINYKKAERLAFRFTFKNPVIQDVNIIFYLRGLGQQSDEEVKLFEKWSAIIRGKMEFKNSNKFRPSA